MKSIVKVSLSGDLQSKLHAAQEKLQSRGADISTERLVCALLSGVSDASIDRVVDEFTPEDYSLRRALKVTNQWN